MRLVSDFFKSVTLNWQMVWEQKRFRYLLLTSIFLVTIVLLSLPFFFQYIEKRNGLLFHDPILAHLPAYDVYLLIFILIWSSAFIMLLTAVKNPSILLLFLIAYFLLSIVRAISIYLLPLEPPSGIINLTDPLTNYFYGTSFITRDLFFSGHTATLFLIFLCIKNKLFKYYTLIACVSVSVLVLIQHIHYSIDVLFAYPFAYLCYGAAKFITHLNEK